MEPGSLSNLSELRAEFDRCWPWLWESLQEFGATHNKEQVWRLICYRKAFFWPNTKCAIVGEFIDHPIGIRSFNYWLQGGVKPDEGLAQLKTMHPGVEAWAIKNGANCALGFGREGWIRAMHGDWKKLYTVRRKWFGPPYPVHGHG